MYYEFDHDQLLCIQKTNKKNEKRTFLSFILGTRACFAFKVLNDLSNVIYYFRLRYVQVDLYYEVVSTFSENINLIFTIEKKKYLE